MGSQVTFDYGKWSARYPELAGPQGVSDIQAQAFFDEATIYWRNDGTGPATSDALQLTLLNMLTAHIAKLNATINGQAPSGLVGRVKSATEGSVSVDTDSGMLPGSAEWYAQTTYGFDFWQATRGFRTARYRSFRRVIPSGGPFGGPGPWGAGWP